MSEQKLIYLVTQGEYSDYQIVRVCSTLELANQYKELIGSDAQVETCPLDLDITLRSYEVNFRKDYSIEKLFELGLSTNFKEKIFLGRRRDGSLYVANIITNRGPEVAKKIASDYLLAILAKYGELNLVGAYKLTED